VAGGEREAPRDHPPGGAQGPGDGKPLEPTPSRAPYYRDVLAVPIPTLIAPANGTNVRRVPEVSGAVGPPVALGKTAASAVVPYLVFERRDRP
jgi:hypothetical protein